MKQQLLALALFAACGGSIHAQGWPAQYEGVMLQGFYWDSFVDSRWKHLEAQSDEMAQYFSLIWVPQSGNCNTSHNNMGYTPVYLFDHNSSFGTTAELRSMINAFRAKGTGVIADVVINHRNNMGVGGSWVDYPAETYKGKTYQMTAADIVANDDKGKTATWAASAGISLSPNRDTGEDWDGCRDIDHQSANVRDNYNAYLDFLLRDLGYTGFRYDMVKGFAPKYVADYNRLARPQFSVGEYWDNSERIAQWIDGTKVDGTPTSAAFDFQFRYAVRDAVNNGNWRALDGSGKNPLAYQDVRKQYAVTFVENHDTQYRDPNNPLDPIKRDTLAANAYLLAMPGTPCVFYKHWLSHKADIKAMIDARRVAGVHNTSKATPFAANNSYYVVRTTGTKGDLLCVVGTGAEQYAANANYVKILSGYHYAYYLSKATNTAWIDVPSGEYEAAFNVKATAVTEGEGQLVYTLDGSQPKADSPTVPANGVLTIRENCTLSVGLLRDGVVQGIATRRYVLRPFVAHDATVYVRNENAWSTTNFYIWDSNNNAQLNGGWPGRRVTTTKEIDGHQWLYQTVNIPKKDYYFSLVVSTDSGSPQTLDIPQITSDRYYVITTRQQGGKYVVEDVTSTITGIEPLTLAPSDATKAQQLYDLTGRRITTPRQGQLYINGLGQKRIAQ